MNDSKTMLAERFTSERLVLRRPETADAQAIYDRYATSDAVTRYLSWPRHRSLDDTRAFLAFSDAAWAQWHAGPLLIEERESGRLLGSTGVACQTPYRVDTGYVLAEDAWGQGFASEALAAVLTALGGTTVWRVEAFCHPEHTTSTSVLEKAGFELDGRLRRHTVFPNLAPEPQDVLVYSRILW
jgi:RimJ/RimL family protein N-acetyltransferase